jgi:glycine dehydrogenase subunit 1
MRYIPNTETQRQEMLRDIGARSADDLFACVPEDVRLKRGLSLPEAMSEMELAAHMKRMAARNTSCENAACFLGAGAYDHFIPSVVRHVLSRQEFYTAYTPYQPEISQGTLQAIFEYQSMICLLTGMDVANASMYDGASALAEAAMMACRAAGRGEVLAARSVSPQNREVVNTYAHFKGIQTAEFGYQNGRADIADIKNKLSDNTAAIIIQSPNFFGVIEDIAPVAELAHSRKAALIVSCDPISLGLLASPGALGADIAVGEGQPLGIPVSFGGPYLGFFAAKEKWLRKMPGRIVGETVDRNGKRGFVLTIQAREQHIRREKATSNICSNEALCALAATVYLTAMGRQGLREAAEQCAAKSRYAYDQLLNTGMFEPVFDAPFFREFALRYKGDIAALNARLLRSGIIGGYDMGRDYDELKSVWLVAVTEKRTRAEIDALAGEVAK